MNTPRRTTRIATAVAVTVAWPLQSVAGKGDWATILQRAKQDAPPTYKGRPLGADEAAAVLSVAQRLRMVPPDSELTVQRGTYQDDFSLNVTAEDPVLDALAGKGGALQAAHAVLRAHGAPSLTVKALGSQLELAVGDVTYTWKRRGRGKGYTLVEHPPASRAKDGPTDARLKSTIPMGELMKSTASMGKLTVNSSSGRSTLETNAGGDPTLAKFGLPAATMLEALTKDGGRATLRLTRPQTGILMVDLRTKKMAVQLSFTVAGRRRPRVSPKSVHYGSI